MWFTIGMSSTWNITIPYSEKDMPKDDAYWERHDAEAAMLERLGLSDDEADC